MLDEMFTENVTQARSELTVEYNQGLYDKLDAGDFYSRLTARQSELSSQFSSGSADPGTDSGTGSSTDSDTSGEKEGGSTAPGTDFLPKQGNSGIISYFYEILPLTILLKMVR